MIKRTLILEKIHSDGHDYVYIKALGKDRGALITIRLHTLFSPDYINAYLTEFKFTDRKAIVIS